MEYRKVHHVRHHNKVSVQLDQQEIEIKLIKMFLVVNSRGITESGDPTQLRSPLVIEIQSEYKELF